MGRLLRSTLLLISAAAVARAADEPGPPGGGPRFFGGRTARRALALPAGTTPVAVRWSVLAFGAEVARGSATVTPAQPRIDVALPDVQRRVPAVLRLDVGETETRRVAIEIFPSARRDVGSAFAGERVGLVAPAGATAPFEASLSDVRRLATPGALRNFGGRVLVLAGGSWDVRPFVPELLARARSGERILALGPTAAPWLRPGVARREARTTEDRAILEGLGDDPLGAWGDAGVLPVTALASPRGNHVEWIPDVVRDCFVGQGRMVLVGLPIAEHVDDEPLAEILLARLARRLLEDPPALQAPRAVRRVRPEDDDRVVALFGERRGLGPAVLTSLLDDSEGATKADGPVLVAGRRSSLFLAERERVEGPGTERPEEFLRFLTRVGLRVETDAPWSAP